MQENNFVNKITGRGEKPISKMPGFHPPDDEEHEYILTKIHKNLKKVFLFFLQIWYYR